MSERNNHKFYIPGIDGMRAIAILAVIAYHISERILPSGFSGVDIFFVISGYVVSSTLARNDTSTFLQFTLNFYKRRILRIFPALILCLLVVSVAYVLFVPSSWLSNTSSKTGLAAFLGYSNIALIWYQDSYFSPKVEFNPFVHTWSLGVEEQFYVLFPFVFFLWLRFRGRRDAAGSVVNLILPALLLLSMVLAWYQTKTSPDRAFYLLPSRFWELATGGALYMLHQQGRMLPASGVSSLFFFVTGALSACLGFVLASNDTFPFPFALLPVTGAVLLISCAVTGGRGNPILAVTLENRVMVYIGKISYSLYLWHWPIFVLLRWTVGFDRMLSIVLGVAVTFMMSVLSYHYIETTVRSNSILRKMPGWVVVPGGVTVIVVIFAVAGILFDSQDRISLSVTNDKRDWYPYAWPSGMPLDDEIAKSMSGKKLYVIGDSHAGAFETMFKMLKDQYGVDVRKSVKGGCSVASMLKPLGKGSECERFIREAVTRIRDEAAPGDIVFLASLRMNRLNTINEVFDEERANAEQYDAWPVKQRRLAFEEAEKLLDELGNTPVQVIISAPLPIFKTAAFRCSDWFNKSNTACLNGFDMKREFLERYRKPVMNSLDELAKEYPNVHIWDPFTALCDEKLCSAFDGEKPLFFDNDHLSAHGNRVLYPSFSSILKQIWL